jgi:hypothetical protein
MHVSEYSKSYYRENFILKISIYTGGDDIIEGLILI